MKATGIVRRIDDLGRVVVPKEIRRTLRIREGDPLEIFTDREGEIILKKYSPIGELGIFAQQYADSIAQTMGQVVAVTDRDQFVAIAGTAKRDFLTKPISKELESLMSERESMVASKGEKNYIKVRDNKPGNVFLGLVHRLDRPTGGVMVFAKTSKCAARLTEQLKNHQMKKFSICAPSTQMLDPWDYKYAVPRIIQIIQWHEVQARIKTAERNINNLRDADDTILMAEREEELKSPLDESERGE